MGGWGGVATVCDGGCPHLVVQEQTELVPGVVQGQEPLEELGEEGGGLLDEHSQQDLGVGLWNQRAHSLPL